MGGTIQGSSLQVRKTLCPCRMPLVQKSQCFSEQQQMKFFTSPQVGESEPMLPRNNDNGVGVWQLYWDYISSQVTIQQETEFEYPDFQVWVLSIESLSFSIFIPSWTLQPFTSRIVAFCSWSLSLSLCLFKRKDGFTDVPFVKNSRLSGSSKNAIEKKILFL